MEGHNHFLKKYKWFVPLFLYSSFFNIKTFFFNVLVSCLKNSYCYTLGGYFSQSGIWTQVFYLAIGIPYIWKSPYTKCNTVYMTSTFILRFWTTVTTNLHVTYIHLFPSPKNQRQNKSTPPKNQVNISSLLDFK